MYSLGLWRRTTARAASFGRARRRPCARHEEVDTGPMGQRKSGLRWLGPFLVLASCLFLSGTVPAQSLITNSGGVLLLNIPSYEPFSPDTTDLCLSLKPLKREAIQTRMPADGIPRLAVVYAAFPPESLAVLSGFCFGVRYSSGFQVVTRGLCSIVAFELPDSAWPGSGSGKLAVCQPAQAIAPGYMLPVYWFVLKANWPGYFELTPHPDPSLGGRFANADIPPFQESISAYGKIGAGLEGFAPETGGRTVKGACCLDRCYPSYDGECEFYRGIYLGAGTRCDNSPCGPAAWKGGCCLPGGCEMLTLIDCARRGGVPLGEDIPCGQAPCPDSSQAAVPARHD
jgi:hypothetical protein